MVIVMDLPSYKMVIFHSYVNVYQRVTFKFKYQIMTIGGIPPN